MGGSPSGRAEGSAEALLLMVEAGGASGDLGLPSSDRLRVAAPRRTSPGLISCEGSTAPDETLRASVA